ncbi:hypothetical protein IG631_03665 [Alternaria alternata]|nr:hypothetical protein IG631_03665 [Alternaria alternata]
MPNFKLYLLYGFWDPPATTYDCATSHVLLLQSACTAHASTGNFRSLTRHLRRGWPPLGIAATLSIAESQY